MLKILSENLRLILAGLLCILMIIAGAVVLGLYFGGNVARKLVVTDISGTVYITRDGRRMNAAKQARLQSGDIVSTDENSLLRISIDSDKCVWVEPNTSVYIYYTDIASRGDISVNLTKGSVICQLNEKLKKKATFSLKTPNSSVSVKGTVFRAEFDYKSEYMGYKNVMITHVQNFDGTVSLQLYDIDKQPVENPMVLIERRSAQMLTSEDVCKYGYLNYEFDLVTLGDSTIGELIRAAADKKLAFTAEELDRAYKIAREERRKQEEAASDTVTEESVSETETTTVTAPPEETSTTAATTAPPPETESEEPSSHGTLSTTLETHDYTTYSGIKWWEITGNTNTGTDGYEDWFTDEGTLPGEETDSASVRS